MKCREGPLLPSEGAAAVSGETSLDYESAAVSGFPGPPKRRRRQSDHSARFQEIMIHLATKVSLRCAQENESIIVHPADFSREAAGRIVRAPEGYWAFVPAPLPPALEPSWELFSRLSEADRALSELAGRAANLPNPHLLIAPFVRREAVLSSRIEGTQASLSDLFFFEAAGPGAESVGRRVPDDVQEVANYVRALEYGLKRTATLPISLRLIREVHGKLMKGARGNHMTPGEFRRTPNWIGPPGCTLLDATYVPPPVPQMRAPRHRDRSFRRIVITCSTPS
jgi:Fic/DOC family protein